MKWPQIEAIFNSLLENVLNNTNQETLYLITDFKHSLKSASVSSEDNNYNNCLGCHKTSPHRNAFLNKHALKVSCQICHIPNAIHELYKQNKGVGYLWAEFTDKTKKQAAFSSRSVLGAQILPFVRDRFLLTSNTTNYKEIPTKDKALKCNDCHGDKGRLDWKALGYKGDPKNPANR